MISRRQIWWLIAITFVALLFWPFSYLASPQWEVFVVDGAGRPRQGVNVRLVYVNYSAESDSHEMTLQTNDSGRVLFLANRSRTNLMQLAVETASAATRGVHASFGRHAHVFAFGD